MHAWAHGMRRAAIGALTLALMCTAGCGRRSDVPARVPEGPANDWMQGYAVPEPGARAESLRAAHRPLMPEDREGASCEDDSACAMPLRCLQGRCDWPAAMTGYADAYTPVAVIETATGPKRFFLEIARSEHERATGLMMRRSMESEFGMLFVFERARSQSFWMRNTLIPLDMIFIRADGVIDSIVENAEPLTDTPRSSMGAVPYVLELEGGAVRFHGIAVGQKVQFFQLD